MDEIVPISKAIKPVITSLSPKDTNIEITGNNQINIIPPSKRVFFGVKMTLKSIESTHNSSIHQCVY